MIDNREFFEKLAKSLIGYFGRIYLVNMKTNEYHRYYMDDNSCLLIEDRSGDDFFQLHSRRFRPDSIRRGYVSPSYR